MELYYIQCVGETFLSLYFLFEDRASNVDCPTVWQISNAAPPLLSVQNHSSIYEFAVKRNLSWCLQCSNDNCRGNIISHARSTDLVKSVSPPFWFGLKYLYYLMDCQEPFYKHPLSPKSCYSLLRWCHNISSHYTINDLFFSVLSWQLLDWLPQYLEQMFMVPRGWFLTILCTVPPSTMILLTVWNISTPTINRLAQSLYVETFVAPKRWRSWLHLSLTPPWESCLWFWVRTTAVLMDCHHI